MKKSLRKCYLNVILTLTLTLSEAKGKGKGKNLFKILRAFHALRMTMVYGLVFSLCLTIAGCGPEWKRKFVRKRTQKKPDLVFTYEPKEYRRGPNDELYKRHFIFWKAWQEELVNELGENRSSDLRSFEEALKNLDEMKDSLKGEKAAELEAYTKELEEFYNIYKSKDFDTVRARQMRQDLDRLMLKMDKLFRYSRIKEFIRDR